MGNLASIPPEPPLSLLVEVRSKSTNASPSPPSTLWSKDELDRLRWQQCSTWDVDVVIRTHARNRRVVALRDDTAEELKEIEDINLAMDWAEQAADSTVATNSRT